jgi:hypothetical protein
LAQKDLRPPQEGNWRYEDVLGWPDGLLFPEATTREVTGELWIPEPNPLVDTGRFFMRLRLLCAGREIARRDSEPIDVVLESRTSAVPPSAAAAPRPRRINPLSAAGTPVGASR